MPAAMVSGKEYKGTQSFDGKWAGTGFYPEETLPYFDFYFKGKQAEHTGYMPNEKLFLTLTTNSPELKVLDVARRNLDSETMGAIMNCCLGNTQLTELNIARNVSFWNEQPDNFGDALAAVLAEPRAKLHLYGKSEPRRARKMGHFTVRAADVEPALARARELKARL